MRRLIYCFSCVCYAALIATASAQNRPGILPPGGAPPPLSGSQNVKGYVRALDGDTIETHIRGAQTLVALTGIEAPEVNTACGQQAQIALELLLNTGSVSIFSKGLDLTEDNVEFFDKKKRREYHLFRNGTSIQIEMLRAGVVRSTAKGKYHKEYEAAEQSAQRLGRGCIWQSEKFPGNKTKKTNALQEAFREVADESSAVKAAAGEGPNQVVLSPGFTIDVVATGLVLPTNFVFLGDGRILISEQAGRVRIYKDGALLPTPFIDIRDRVNGFGDRGLIGMAVDPNFATNGYVYLHYTYENDPVDYAGPKTARLTRVTAVGDTASPATETVILGTKVGRS